MWNELTFLWIDLTIECNDLTLNTLRAEALSRAIKGPLFRKVDLEQSDHGMN